MLCVGEHWRYSGTCFSHPQLNPVGFIFHSRRQFSNSVWHSWAARSSSMNFVAVDESSWWSHRGNNSWQSFMTCRNVVLVELHVIKSTQPKALRFILTAQQFFSLPFRTILAGMAKFSAFHSPRDDGKRRFLHIRNSTMPSAEIIFHYYANYHENMVEILFGTLPEHFHKLSRNPQRRLSPQSKSQLSTKINFHGGKIINSNTAGTVKLWKLITGILLTQQFRCRDSAPLSFTFFFRANGESIGKISGAFTRNAQGRLSMTDTDTISWAFTHLIEFGIHYRFIK